MRLGSCCEATPTTKPPVPFYLSTALPRMQTCPSASHALPHRSRVDTTRGPGDRSADLQYAVVGRKIDHFRLSVADWIIRLSSAGGCDVTDACHVKPETVLYLYASECNAHCYISSIFSRFDIRRYVCMKDYCRKPEVIR